MTNNGCTSLWSRHSYTILVLSQWTWVQYIYNKAIQHRFNTCKTLIVCLHTCNPVMWFCQVCILYLNQFSLKGSSVRDRREWPHCHSKDLIGCRQLVCASWYWSGSGSNDCIVKLWDRTQFKDLKNGFNFSLKKSQIKHNALGKIPDTVNPPVGLIAQLIF